MKIGLRRYLYMFSIALIANLLCIFNNVFFAMPYSGGGVKIFVEENFDKTLLFFQCKMDEIELSALFLIAFVEIIPYFIIIICAVKMIKYVNLHTGFDANMKMLVKQLTKTLIIL
uniref:G_PROTEIN_RECEP_F1_2 domain-containing protein n=1 Tax=Meloidogyne hapla TaxID=6305 RepID=A0A1I8B914_MELHA